MKRMMALLMAISVILAIPVRAFATTEYYAVETNTEDSQNPDPVYIPLDDSNSTVTEDGRAYTGEQTEGKSYEVISKEVTDTVVYQITGESTGTADLTPGESYTFTPSAADVEVGQVLETPLESGAVLTYTGDGKTECYSYDEYGTQTPSTASVSSIFKDDIRMIEDAQESLSERIALKNQFSDENAVDCFIIDMLKGGYELEDTEISTYEELEAAIMETDENATAENIRFFYDYYKNEINSIITTDYANPEDYDELLAEMKAVDSSDEAAILEYLGMTAEEVKTFKGNLYDSNTPVTSNSGIVHVVTPGAGFDDCEDGAIFYREELGWSYACVGGGVGMGDSSGLKLYSVESTTLSADAFTVAAGDAIQLDKDGKAVAGLKNVKATVKLPNNEVKELISFEFADDKVNLNDPHVTAIIGGRYYTVTLDLKKWVEEKTEEIPVTIEPAAESPKKAAAVVYAVPRTSDTNETLTEFSTRMNSTADFSGVVKNADYQDEAYKTEAAISNNSLSITAVVKDGQELLRRLVLNQYLITKLTELRVSTILFSIGNHRLSIAVSQLAALSDVVITMDPAARQVVILVNGADRTADFVFTYTVD